MKLPRTLWPDDDDGSAYERAAEPGEWAIAGTFAFIDDTDRTLRGKRRQAFASGFLGTSTFGWCSLVEVAWIDDDGYAEVIDRVAQYLVREHGAPHIAAALPVAAGEVAHASSICSHPLHTLLGIQRNLSGEGVVESLRVLRPGNGLDHARVKLFGST